MWYGGKGYSHARSCSIAVRLLRAAVIRTRPLEIPAADENGTDATGAAARGGSKGDCGGGEGTGSGAGTGAGVTICVGAGAGTAAAGSGAGTGAGRGAGTGAGATASAI